MSLFSGNNSDSSFGPVSDARSFDFTLLFEDTILTIVPAGVFLVAAGLRAAWLINKPNTVTSSFSRLTKLVILSAFATTQLTVLVSRVSNLDVGTKVSIPATALDFTAACALFLLSCFEHSRSVTPSTIIGLYLLVSVPFDAVRLRTYFLLDVFGSRGLANLLSLSLAIKLIVLIAEAIEKRSILLEPYRDLPPEATSGIYNKTVFWWLNPLLSLGFRTTLRTDDLFTLDKTLSSADTHKRFQREWSSIKVVGRFSLLLTTAKVLKWQLLISAIPRLCLSAARFTQPFLARQTINFVAHQEQPSANGWGLVGAYFLIYLVQAISTAAYRHLLNRCVTQVRGGLVSLLYNKTAELRMGTVDPTASLTLMSSDIQRMTETLILVHDLWCSVIEIGIAMFLLYLDLGTGCAGPAIVYVLQLVGTAWATNVISAYQKRWLNAIQTRVSFTSSLLHSMRNVKLLGMSSIIKDRTQNLRVDEVNECKKYRFINNFIILFQNSAGIFAPFAAFLFSYLQSRSTNQSLNLATSFSILTILRLAEVPLNVICYSAPHVASSIACFERIQHYLLADSWHDNRLSLTKSTDASDPWESESQGPGALEMSRLGGERRTLATEALSLKDCSFGWSREDIILKDIDATIHCGSLTMIIGPVGCGKSTLLKGILGETPVTQGFVYLRNKSIAFADQEPWIQNATIRDAIRGPRAWEDRPLDRPWYQEVINCCGLAEDIAAFPLGDMTLIGSKGISLSGGQKQRLALARALYTKAEILLLDDVFSGLDKDTEEHIFKKLFNKSGPLRRMGTTVIMVTHAVHRLSHADMILSVGETGQITERGPLSALLQGSGYVQSLNLKAKQRSNEQDETHAAEPENTSPLFKTRSSLTTTSVEDNEARDLIRRTGEWSSYKHWFKSCGYVSSLLSLLEASLWMVAVQTPGVLVKIFSHSMSSDSGQSSSAATTFITLFGVTTIIASLSVLGVAWQIFLDMVPRSAQFLHLNLLESVVNAPLSFFTKTDVGTITNRFSQDMGLVDADLPYSYADFVLSLVSCVAGIALMSASGSGYFAAIIPVLLGSLYVIQKYYLRTSRQMRLLDLEEKAPLYTLFGETAAGLASIRAFGWTDRFADRNLVLLDRSQRPFYLMFCIQRWLALVLDLLVAGLVTVLVIIVVVRRDSMDPGLVGLGLLSAVSLSNSLTELVKTWTSLETSVGAISRLQEFARTTESEHKPLEVQTVRPTWPENGEVDFRGFEASYSIQSPLVLRDIDLRIRLGEKIGICGRSGSGKSSMLASLFHLLEFRNGSIVVDGVDASTIPRETLRSRLNVIPQEPWWVTTDTVRFNMDPWGANDAAGKTPLARDADFISALKKCQIWHVIEDKGGLDAVMTPEFLSHGQRQLFCLARAILRESKVVVLDEVSASVDLKTDLVMQQVIKECFERCTVISVAHRLNTIDDGDRVVVLHQGRIVEVGDPQFLLKASKSRFKELYET
ncbi:hypothetical protein B0A52_06262 [Exophiala mesophila]|uniref:ABC transporter n=1 Tax=Exophiala mesophila TaxID=212818 RepID=A0A438N2X3_EXOME|nr:hypothetical protein B0A52_06262 [Exophiala mesophila]